MGTISGSTSRRLSTNARANRSPCFGTMKRLLCLGLLSLLACGDSTGAGSIAGVWGLDKIDGAALPGITGCCSQILADELVIRANGSFTETYTQVDTPSVTPTTYADNGHWSLKGAEFTMVYSGNGNAAYGLWNGNRLTIIFDKPWEFNRR